MGDAFTNPAEKLVLIVDDDQDIVEMLEHAMKREGFRVAVAPDGADAQAKVRGLRPDLILLDLMLPKAGGFEIIQALQAEGDEDIPVVLMTGRQMERSTLQMMRQQPNVKDFFEKPIRMEMLTASVHQILRTRPVR